MSDDLKPSFRVAQIYLVNTAFRHRGLPLALPHTTPLPEQQIGVKVGMVHLNDGEATQVTVAVATDPEDGNEKALYDFAVEVAGLVDQVDREKFPDKELAKTVAMMIYPFVREAVANVTGRGRFGAVWLNPVDLINLFQRNAEQERRETASVAETAKEKAPRRET